MYTLLTGTKKNAGDFLIAHAAKRLFERFAPIKELLELPSWRPIDEHLDAVNASQALVLCGGPAYQPGIGMHIYPILPVLERIRVPIISFGLGWKGVPGDDDDVAHYQFPNTVEPLFHRLRSDFAYAGCRDYLTWRVLKRFRFDNAWMTGCPAWYDPDCFGKGLVVPDEVRQIVVTPAEHPRFRGQSAAVMRVVREAFPNARTVCSFHRGWTADEYTTASHAANARVLKQRAEALGMEARDVSGGVDGMLGYDQFDLHVGYRVHAHLKLLSLRKPSFLIAEDGRGRGVLEAMGLCGVQGWRTPAALRLCNRWTPTPTARKLARRAFGPLAENPQAAEQLKLLLREEVQNRFSRFHGALAVIDATWERMHTMLKALPN